MYIIVWIIVYFLYPVTHQIDGLPSYNIRSVFWPYIRSCHPHTNMIVAQVPLAVRPSVVDVDQSVNYMNHISISSQIVWKMLKVREVIWSRCRCQSRFVSVPWPRVQVRESVRKVSVSRLCCVRFHINCVAREAILLWKQLNLQLILSSNAVSCAKSCFWHILSVYTTFMRLQ